MTVSLSTLTNVILLSLHSNAPDDPTHLLSITNGNISAGSCIPSLSSLACEDRNWTPDVLESVMMAFEIWFRPVPTVISMLEGVPSLTCGIASQVRCLETKGW